MSKLSEIQRAAASHGDGPMMVLAGPGSGKTTVIIHRVDYLIKEKHINPRNILVITFTKAATEEMRKRFEGLAGEGGAGVTFSTFHALFYRIIRSRHNLAPNALLSDGERNGAIKRLITAMGVEADDELVQSVCNEISKLKNDLIEPQNYNPASLGADEFLGVVKAYEAYKNENGRLDFDDMLSRCYGALAAEPALKEQWSRQYPFVLVDEFQDINRVQFEGLRLLTEQNRNIFVVGDDDQSIYKFRGARPEFLLHFPQIFPDAQKIVLQTNYRSTDQIISLCNRIILLNQQRYHKDIVGTGRGGGPPVLISPQDINDEARQIGQIILSLGDTPREQIAVVYRTNIQARAFVDACMNLRIPFQVRDEMPSVYQHWIARDILAYFQLALNPEDNRAMERVANKPKRYLSKDLIARAKKQGGILYALLNTNLAQRWQLAKVEELVYHLAALRKRGAHDAIVYLRRNVGYNDYIRENAAYHKWPLAPLLETLQELEEAAKEHKTLADFMAHAEAVRQRTTKPEYGAENSAGPARGGVVLTTMHSAKGLEFDTVFVAGAVEGVIPHERCRAPQEIEEERRLFYVALTRAKTRLYISVMKNRYEEEAEPTRFLSEVLQAAQKAAGRQQGGRKNRERG